MIYGKRIRLRGIEKTDIPVYYEWINDPEVRQGLSLYLPMSMSDEEQWFESVRQSEPAARPLAIERLHQRKWRLIGNCGFFNIEWTNRAAELGIMIGDKSVWNQGYGTETVRLLLQHGFETLNFHRIFLRVYATNPRAIRSYEKAGFVHEGSLREALYQHGTYTDIHVMSVLYSEWKGPREGK